MFSSSSQYDLNQQPRSMTMNLYLNLLKPDQPKHINNRTAMVAAPYLFNHNLLRSLLLLSQDISSLQPPRLLLHWCSVSLIRKMRHRDLEVSVDIKELLALLKRHYSKTKTCADAVDLNLRIDHFDRLPDSILLLIFNMIIEREFVGSQARTTLRELSPADLPVIWNGSYFAMGSDLVNLESQHSDVRPCGISQPLPWPSQISDHKNYPPATSPVHDYLPTPQQEARCSIFTSPFAEAY